MLSTCNRLEVYVVARSFHPAVREVEAWLCAASGVRLEELRPSLFAHRGDEATEHLMRVAAGLDSLVVGEGQILAQVSRKALLVLLSQYTNLQFAHSIPHHNEYLYLCIQFYYSYLRLPAQVHYYIERIT